MNATLKVAAVTIFLLAAANPSISDYAEWVQKQTSDKLNSKSLAGLVLGSVVNISTIRENYVLFSIFNTDLGAQHRIEAVGFASKVFVALTADRPVHTFRQIAVPAYGDQSGSIESQENSNICFDGDGKHIVLSRVRLSSNVTDGALQIPVSFDAVVSSVLRYLPENGFKILDSTEFDFFPPGELCKPFSKLILHGVDNGRAETLTLDGKTIIHLVGVSFGGSGERYTHVILSLVKGGVKTLTPFKLTHSNMGGFFIGKLDGDNHSGIVLWDAVWETGIHYSPHPYQTSIYQWDGTQFLPPKIASTTQSFEPSPDEFPTKMGLPFRDLTAQSRFNRWTP